MSAVRRVLGSAGLLLAAWSAYATWPGHFAWSPRVEVAPAAFPSPVLDAGAFVASDGESYLMVTSDDRGTRAMRMDAEGRIANPGGIALRGNGVLDVAGNGSEWLITTYGNVLLLGRDGVVKYPPVYLPQPRAISNGRGFFAWPTPGMQPTRAAVIRADGSAVYVDERALPRSMDAASNGDVYCIAARIANAIFINIIDDAGRPLFAEPRKLIDVPLRDGRELLRIALARVHGDFRVFWTEKTNSVFHEREGDVAWALSSVDFDAGGTVVSPPRVVAAGVIRGRSYDFYGDSLEVVQAGPADAVVRWSMGLYLPPMQTTLGCGTVFPGVAGQLASNGRSVLMVHRERISESATALTLRRAAFACDSTGLLAAERELPVWAAPEQKDVSIVAARADAIVAYKELGRRHARRVSHAGRTLATITLPDEVHDATWFRIATDGHTYFAFWIPRAASAVRYVKLADSSPSLPVVKTVAPLSAQSDGFDAQWNGSAFLVVWTGKGGTYGGGEPILGALITRGGAVLDPGVIEIVSPDFKFWRTDLALSHGAGDTLLAWTDRGAGTGLPCGGCTNPAGARALRLGPDARALGAIRKLSDWNTRMETLVRNDGAWYVFIYDYRDSHNHVSRIDDAGNVRDLDLGYAGFDESSLPSPHVAAFPMGMLGVGVYNGRSFDLLDSTLDYLSEDAAPALAGAGPASEVAFAPAAHGRVLAVFTPAIEESPYDGAHRAFVSFVDFIGDAPKRRAVR